MRAETTYAQFRLILQYLSLASKKSDARLLFFFASTRIIIRTVSRSLKRDFRWKIFT